MLLLKVSAKLLSVITIRFIPNIGPYYRSTQMLTLFLPTERLQFEVSQSKLTQ
jgi:hypothetical protein